MGHKQGHSPHPYTPFPDPLHTRGNLGALTCAARGAEYLLGLKQREITEYADIGVDWLGFWPVGGTSGSSVRRPVARLEQSVR